MATRIFQSYENSSSIPGSGSTRCCVLHVPFAHRLVSAKAYSQNVVTTGTVTVTLKKRDTNESQGGSQVGTVLENDDLEDYSAVNTEYEFELAARDTRSAPADRQYLLVLVGTNAADRFDEPLLVVTVEDRV